MGMIDFVFFSGSEGEVNYMMEVFCRIIYYLKILNIEFKDF